MPFVTEDDKKSYLLFLKGLLKDKPYVALAYMTGILPIAKYSSGSELNMFMEYTMVRSLSLVMYLDFQIKKLICFMKDIARTMTGKKKR